jgi:hypothetical protein
VYLTTGELIAGGLTLVGVALGGAITFAITDRQVKSAEEEGARQRAFDADQRKLDRQHEIELHDEGRRLEAYVPLIKMVATASGFSERSLEWLEADCAPDKHPGYPSFGDDDVFHVAALIASPELSAAISRMVTTMRELVAIVPPLEGGQIAPVDAEQRARAIEVAGLLQTQADDTRQLIRAEVGARPLPRSSA